MLRRLLPYCHDLWSHRDLLRQFAVRTVQIRHKGSHLGLLWSVFNPLLMLGLYVFVFGFIFGGRFGIIENETGADYAIGIFFGLTLFGFIGEVMAVAPTIIIANPNFVKKVVFPLEILPAAHVAAAGFHLLISLGLALIFLVVFGRTIHPELIWLPVIIFPLILLALGVTWIFATLGVFFRDIGQLMQFLTLSLMYSSAVFFSATKIPASMWVFLKFNPLLLAIELARNTALWAQPMNYHHLGYLYLFSIVTCHVGYVMFRKMKPAFSDVL